MRTPGQDSPPTNTDVFSGGRVYKTPTLKGRGAFDTVVMVFVEVTAGTVTEIICMMSLGCVFPNDTGMLRNGRDGRKEGNRYLAKYT